MSLVVVMIVLTIMLLGVVGILRSSNGTLSIVGNLGFKQNATSVADIGVEVARAYLLNRSSTQLAVSDATGAYFEVGNGSFDPTTYDWTTAGNSVVATPDDGTGNVVSYVIHRMCSLTGTVDAPNQQCVLANPANAGGSNQVSGLTAGVGITKSPFYRITAMVQGPRNTLSYVQVMVY
jgi:hypothetical protein